MTASQETICLPNLPGYKPRLPLAPGDKKHYKKTSLTYLRGYAVDEPPVRAVSEAIPAAEARLEAKRQPEAAQPLEKTSPSAVSPKWIENDKKVLRWFGYFKEAVPESPVENFRVRRLVICFYLADDTTEVLEPRTQNSGLWQGPFLKRHKVLKPDGALLKPEDIKVRENLAVYGRAIRIVDADAFTRAYLGSRGCALAAPEPYPQDPFEAKQAAAAAAARGHAQEGSGTAQQPAVGTVAQQGRLQAYLLNSKKVLRFFCVWDDRQRLYGDRRPFSLHFYLEDGTMEILEIHDTNSGRDRAPAFLRRSLVPKDSEGVVMGSTVDRKRCFGLEDFRIGTFMCVYGRDFYIHDCDDFTRRWYQDNMGCSPEVMAAVDVKEAVPADSSSRCLPPYNGYGSLEDSAENCRRLLPHPPKKDVYKLMNQGKIVLRFGAELQLPARKPVGLEDASERRFVVSYFMGDDAISVFEHPTDGHPGGKFLERGVVPRPEAELGDHILDTDLFVGATLNLHGHTFLLRSADEYTLQFMENNRQKYPMADWQASLDLLKHSLIGREDDIRAALKHTRGEKITSEAFIAMLQRLKLPLATQQALSVHRRLGKNPAGATAETLLELLDL